MARYKGALWPKKKLKTPAVEHNFLLNEYMKWSPLGDSFL